MAKKKTSLAAYPYFAWSALFIVIPLLIVLFFSFTVQTDSGYSFSLENYSRLISSQYFNIFLRSI
ncbi:MAG: ABC transporter permease, partial [Clostridium butyricum]|nr:ABC transporter permease [Clostridium butyricum]